MSQPLTVLSDTTVDETPMLYDYHRLVADPLQIYVQICAYRKVARIDDTVRQQLAAPVIVLDTSSPEMLNGAVRYIAFMESTPARQRGIVLIAPWYKRGLANSVESLPPRHPLRQSPSMQFICRWMDRMSRRDSVYIETGLTDAIRSGIYLTHQFLRADNESIKQHLSRRQVINFTRE